VAKPGDPVIPNGASVFDIRAPRLEAPHARNGMGS
jgi:hypothetical protein